MAGFSHAENLADASSLAAMLSALNGMSKPTVARVHGAAYGGGVGLVACCDIAIGTPDATFALSETRLGLIPAAISPYVIEAIGARAARRYFLTAERFTAAEAFRLGLLHDLAVALDDTDQRRTRRQLAQGGPERAGANARRCSAPLRIRPIDAAVIADTVRRIAAVRASAEGQGRRRRHSWASAAAWIPTRRMIGPWRWHLDTMQLIALAAALGWASGYGFTRFCLSSARSVTRDGSNCRSTAHVLAHPMVLAASGFMVVAEFFADKIPGFDSVWDLVHTLIRIPAGAALAASVFGDSPPAWMLASAILGGTLAAGSHFTKAGARLAINTSPEPMSNWAASFGEDLLVGAALSRARAPDRRRTSCWHCCWP